MLDKIDQEYADIIEAFYKVEPECLQHDIVIAGKLIKAYTAYADLHYPSEYEIVKRWVHSPDDMYNLWDDFGWTEPAHTIWNLLSACSKQKEADVFFVNSTCKFIWYYMNKYYSKYAEDKECGPYYWYKFNIIDATTEEQNDYDKVFYSVVEWLVYMLDKYGEEIRRRNNKKHGGVTMEKEKEDIGTVAVVHMDIIGFSIRLKDELFYLGEHNIPWIPSRMLCDLIQEVISKTSQYESHFIIADINNKKDNCKEAVKEFFRILNHIAAITFMCETPTEFTYTNTNGYSILEHVSNSFDKIYRTCLKNLISYILHMSRHVE